MSFDIVAGVIYSAFFSFGESGNLKKRPVLALSEKDENGDVRIAFITKHLPRIHRGFYCKMRILPMHP